MFMRTLSHGFKPINNYDINPTEGRTLMIISDNEGQPMKNYCEKTDLETGSFTYAVNKLEEKGLVLRESDINDRRIRSLVLTDKGRVAANNIRHQFETFVTSKLYGLDSQDQQKLLDAMLIISDINQKLADKR